MLPEILNALSSLVFNAKMQAVPVDVAVGILVAPGLAPDPVLLLVVERQAAVYMRDPNSAILQVSPIKLFTTFAVL